MSGRLEGKVAIVTGASSGVGAATLALFAREGAQVVGAARRQEVLDEVVADVRAAGGDAHVVAADLSGEEAAQRVVDETTERYGRVDVVVNSAGVGWAYGETNPGSMDALDTTTADMWDHVMAINLGSAMHVTRLALPGMLEQGSGSIVNVASISGFTGLTTAHTYTAAKGAIINLTRSLAITYAQQGLRANCVAPGFIDTPMVAPVIGIFEDEVVRYQVSPMGRAARPEEVAYGCLFFAGDEAPYCNGSVLTMDGGTTARAFV